MILNTCSTSSCDFYWSGRGVALVMSFAILRIKYLRVERFFGDGMNGAG